MKARIPLPISVKQKKQLNCLIKEQVSDFNKQWEQDFECMMVWVLHKHYGFGIKRMLAFRKLFMQECRELRKTYEMDAAYPARAILKNLGYDVEALQAQDDKESALLTAEETTAQLHNK